MKRAKIYAWNQYISYVICVFTCCWCVYATLAWESWRVTRQRTKEPAENRAKGAEAAHVMHTWYEQRVLVPFTESTELSLWAQFTDSVLPNCLQSSLLAPFTSWNSRCTWLTVQSMSLGHPRCSTNCNNSLELLTLPNLFCRREFSLFTVDLFSQ